MAFITTDSALALARQIRLSGINPSEPLYRLRIPFFSTWEKQCLLAHRELVRNPEHFFASLHFLVLGADTLKFIHEPGRPVYHSALSCPELEINFRKYLIPGAIRDKGTSAVRSYRRWFKAIRRYLDQGKAEIFLAHLKAKWDISAAPSDIVQVILPENETRADDLQSIDNRIVRLLSKADWYLAQSEAHRIILDKYHKSTFLAHIDSPIRDNDTGYDDVIVREILNAFDTTFKQPLKHLLTEMHRLRYNPQLSFDTKLLNRTGMDKCPHCHHPEFKKQKSEGGEGTVYYEDMLYLRALDWKWKDVSGLN